MLEIKAAREIHGTIDIPPSIDLLMLGTTVALAAGIPVTIGPVPDSSLARQWKETLSSQLLITDCPEGWHVSPREDACREITISSGTLPHRDFLLGVLLGLGLTVRIREISQSRLDYWQQRFSSLGQHLIVSREDPAAVVSITEPAYIVAGDDPYNPDDLMAVLGLALGRGCPISVRTNAPFSDPLRPCLNALGYELTVKSSVQIDDDPIKKRLRFLQKGRKTEEPVSYTISADFGKRPQEARTLTVPGDETLVSLFLCAKSLVQKGNLIIRNAPLEAWAGHMLDFVRKMGCRPGIQEESQTSFGTAGMLQLQSFGLTNRKTVCRPVHQYVTHLPAMVVTAGFAPGQSVFRGLEDVRTDQPDMLDQLVSCLERLGARHGDMPDGIVVDGARQFDGFDLQQTGGAAIDGAFAVAGLKCIGTTTIPEESIYQRWPAFRDLLLSVCEFK